jgi:hypothetical protein
MQNFGTYIALVKIRNPYQKKEIGVRRHYQKLLKAKNNEDKLNAPY